MAGLSKTVAASFLGSLIGLGAASLLGSGLPEGALLGACIGLLFAIRMRAHAGPGEPVTDSLPDDS